jgi:hypothetical protein
MCFETEEDNVDGADLPRVVRNRWSGREIPPGRAHADAVAAHRLQICAAGDEVDIGASARKGGAYVRTDRTRSEHCDLHELT